MPLNKSTTYHQSVQFFVQFFFKKNLSFYLVKNFFFKKNFLKDFFTQFYLKSTKFYNILLSFTSSGTQFYQIPRGGVDRSGPDGGTAGTKFAGGAVDVARTAGGDWGAIAKEEQRVVCEM